MAKILVVTQHYWPESFRINDLCEGFVEQGHEVEVLCGQPNYPQGQWYPGYGPFKNRKEVHNGVKIRRTFEVKRGNNSYIRIFFNYIMFPMASLTHMHYLKKQNYDKIFLYQTSPVMMSIAGILLGRKKKIETTMYVLDIWPQNLYSLLNFKSKFIRKILENISAWHYKNVTRLVTVSNRLREHMIDELDINPENICFIPQCCEKLYEKTILDEELEQRFSKGFNIVFTGNISPLQSFETILESAKMLKADGLKDINYIIVGDGMSAGWLKDEVEKADLIENFFFEGFRPVEDIPKYTHIADALIACLSKNGLEDFNIPAKVMSYIASGKPVLLSMNGEVRHIIKQAECGYTCEAEDSIGLYNNIKDLYCLEKEELKKLGENASKYHLENFERNKNLVKMLDFILGK